MTSSGGEPAALRGADAGGSQSADLASVLAGWHVRQGRTRMGHMLVLAWMP
jgi:hypothetical protein